MFGGVLPAKDRCCWREIYVSTVYQVCLFGFNVPLKHLRSFRDGVVILWPMCCHTGIPCSRHRTWHPNPSQYTDTWSTCHTLIHSYQFLCLGSNPTGKSFCITRHWTIPCSHQRRAVWMGFVNFLFSKKHAHKEHSMYQLQTSSSNHEKW